MNERYFDLGDCVFIADLEHFFADEFEMENGYVKLNGTIYYPEDGYETRGELYVKLNFEPTSFKEIAKCQWFDYHIYEV